MFQTKLVEKIGNTDYIQKIFSEFRTIYKIMCQKAVQHNRLLTVI